eukprot:3045265-Rhodomonas_salina.2
MESYSPCHTLSWAFLTASAVSDTPSLSRQRDWCNDCMPVSGSSHLDCATVVGGPRLVVGASPPPATLARDLACGTAVWCCR